MNTGEKIKQARRKVGLTQKDLAARMDTSQSYIAQYENGTRNAKPATLRRISEAIGCQLSDLIGDTVEMVIRVYGHLYPNKQKEVATRLQQLLQ